MPKTKKPDANCYIIFSYWCSKADYEGLYRLAAIRGIGRAEAVRRAVRKDLKRAEAGK